MEELQRLYRDALRAKLDALADARARLRGGAEASAGAAGGADAVTAARRLAHTLRGSGGTYGFPELSRVAAAAEDAPAEQLPERMDDLIAQVRATIDGTPT